MDLGHGRERSRCHIKKMMLRDYISRAAVDGCLEKRFQVVLILSWWEANRKRRRRGVGLRFRVCAAVVKLETGIWRCCWYQVCVRKRSVAGLMTLKKYWNGSGYV